MLQIPSFTADYSLVFTGNSRDLGAWTERWPEIYPAALPVRCGSCRRVSEDPDVCEQSCCRVERIEGDDDPRCFARSCDCPPCGGCEADAGSPTGASVTCCYPTTTPFHRAGCTKRSCKLPPPPPPPKDPGGDPPPKDPGGIPPADLGCMFVGTDCKIFYQTCKYCCYDGRSYSKPCGWCIGWYNAPDCGPPRF
jgi:hypothetical protein